MIESGAEDFADLEIAQAGEDVRIDFANVRIVVENADSDGFAANDFIF